MDVVVTWVGSLVLCAAGTWLFLRERHRRDVAEHQERWGTYHAALEARLDERMRRIEALERRLGATADDLGPELGLVADEQTVDRLAELVRTLGARTEPSPELGELSRDVHDRLETLAGDLDAICRALDETTRACEAARRTLGQRVVPATQRLVDLSGAGVPRLALDPEAPRALASGDD